jgi:hypothetical protein
MADVFKYVGKKVTDETLDAMYKTSLKLVSDNFTHNDGHCVMNVKSKDITASRIVYSDDEFWDMIVTPERLEFEYRDRSLNQWYSVEIAWRSHVYPETIWMQEHANYGNSRIPEKINEYINLIKNSLFYEIEGTIMV